MEYICDDPAYHETMRRPRDCAYIQTYVRDRIVRGFVRLARLGYNTKRHEPKLKKVYKNKERCSTEHAIAIWVLACVISMAIMMLVFIDLIREPIETSVV